MRRATSLLISVLGLASFLSSHPGLAQAEYRKADAETVNRYKSALVAYEKALKFLEKKDLDGALSALAVSVEKMPDFPDAHFLLARIHYGEKEFTRALEEIELARAGFEHTADLRDTMQNDRRKGIVERIRQKDVAISEQTARLQTVPPAQRQSVEATLERLKNERNVLEREIQQYSAGPSAIPARYNCLNGNILLRLQKETEAVARYQEALKVDPAYGEAANNLASIYHMAGQNEKALEVVTAAEKQGAKLHPELKKSIEAALAKRPSGPG